MIRTHRCDARCAVIIAMRRNGHKYAVIGKRLGLTSQRVGQIGKEHSRRGEFPARLREGDAWCITCRRELDPRIPESKLLPKEDCCGWCGRRWDGGLMGELTALLSDLTSVVNGGPDHHTHLSSRS